MEKITKEHLSKRTESTKVVINGITTDVCKRMYISALPEEICNVLQKAFPSCSDIEELDNETLEVVKEHVLICKDAGTLVRYALSDIMYLKAAGDSCDIFFSDMSHIMVSNTLSESSKDLPSRHFIRVHKSAVLNISYIKELQGNCFVMQNKQAFVIGRKYKEEVERKFIHIRSRRKKKAIITQSTTE